MMEISNLIPHIEALIFASEKPLTTLEITDLINQAFGFMEDKIMLDQIEAAMEGILEKYKAEFYPFEVRESGGGWQFLTKRDFHKTVAQLNGDKFLKRLSTAALETLSIVAYKQPVTKSEIEAIRGVSSDYAIQKLLEKDLIVITGRNENMPGQPLVYATSKNFMDYFGLNTTDDLPKLKEILDDSIVAPTIVGLETGTTQTEGDESGILPSENDVHVNGTELSLSEEEGAEEEAQPGLDQDASYDQEADEEAIAEEAEALDEEAGEVLDEIAEEGFDEGDLDAFAEEEPYITPEEEEEGEDDSTSFAVDDNGELIEEHGEAEEDEEENEGDEEIADEEEEEQTEEEEDENEEEEESEEEEETEEEGGDDEETEEDGEDNDEEKDGDDEEDEQKK
ncbi:MULTISPECIES: SMC-Scp complex subunit ScpB [Niastella]|uniref:SMC-Scp complex subunit ScpB n=1 Tax=Niastella soli TaxID=2821487 RepID=A0ABS3YLK8_9BACT|nr:SMC-Scp complex subunit ScpB [Niastella soli]MBO9198756.1 SMC-Scp complex subunit ScpB [Niastella soli]